MAKKSIKYANYLGKCYICGKDWCDVHDKHSDDCCNKKEKNNSSRKTKK